MERDGAVGTTSHALKKNNSQLLPAAVLLGCVS